MGLEGGWITAVSKYEERAGEVARVVGEDGGEEDMESEREGEREGEGGRR